MFSDGKLPDEWTAASGEWEVTDGALAVDASGELATVFFGDAEEQNYELSAKITFESIDKKNPWAALVFRAGEEGELPLSLVSVHPDVKDSAVLRFTVQTDKGRTVRGSSAVKDKQFELNQSRDLRVVVRGTEVEAYLDGKKVLESVYCVDRDQGCLGLAANHCRVKFDDVTIRSLSPSRRTFSQLKRKPCGVVAHRGYSAIAPENTLLAVREAIQAGSHGCEFDVYTTKDGRLVLLHDGTVDRTTDGKGKIAELTFDYVRGLDAGSWKDKKKYTGEQVPTLDEALAELKDSGCIPVIEIKVEGISRQVVDAVRRADMLDQAAVIAFSGKVVKEIRQLEPNLPCYWLWSAGLDGTPKERAARIVREAAKHDTNMVDLNYNMLSEEVIRELKRRGVKVWCWTVNDPAVMDALLRWGVESITTDRPNDVLRLIKEK